MCFVNKKQNGSRQISLDKVEALNDRSWDYNIDKSDKYFCKFSIPVDLKRFA